MIFLLLVIDVQETLLVETFAESVFGFVDFMAHC